MLELGILRKNYTKRIQIEFYLTILVLGTKLTKNLKKNSIKFLLLILIVTEVSCSHTKYKGFRQYFTNFTSYYNTYFNIQNKYRVGYRQSTQLAQENTNDIVSVFEYENDPDLFKGSSQFNETAPKVSKLLTLRPYNKWMDDAILVQGKISYLRADYDSAITLLAYVVDNYPKGYYNGHLPSNRRPGYDEMVKMAGREKKPIKQPRFKFHFAKNEATIWLIKAYIKRKQYERAQTLIFQAEGDMSFPQEYRNALLKTQIMLQIEQEQYQGAIEKLNVLLEQKLKKKDASRMQFILAQLYEKLGDHGSANTHYVLALKGKLKNDLEFEAKLKSLTYDNKNADVALSKLKKMLNKGSYSNNLDKLYLAIGKVYEGKDDEANAIKNYKLASANSKSNNIKFVVFDKIGSLYYKKSNYLEAANYYDSALQVIPTNYPKKNEFTKKTEALKALLVHYRNYIKNDSILDLTALGEIGARDKIEKAVRKEQSRMKAEELFKETTKLNPDVKAPSVVTSSPTVSGGSWYFSSKENVEKGKIAFQKKWGKITRTDNWNKSKGSSIAIQNDKGDLPEVADHSSMSPDMIAEIEVRKLPFDEKDKAPLISEVQTSLIGMARIYSFEIKDIDKAIETYEILFKKYSTNLSSEDEALYSLYRLYLDKDDVANATRVKSMLVAKFPQSKYSMYANNPNAKSQDEKSDLTVAKSYREAFLEYKRGNYELALGICNSLEADHKDHALLPKIQLLKAYIYSSSNMFPEFKSTLETILAKSKDSLVNIDAKELLDILNKVDREKINLVSQSLPIDKVNAIESVAAVKPDLVNPIEQNKKQIQSGENSIKEEKMDPILSEISSPSSKSSQITDSKKLEESFSNYEYDPSSSHYLLFKLKGSLSQGSAKTVADIYFKTKWSHFRLKSEFLQLGSDKYLTIGKLATLDQAKSLQEAVLSDAMMQTLVKNSDLYLISTSNLDILYISMDWNSYMSFYNKRYR